MQGCTGKLKQRIRNRDVLITGCIMDCRSGAVVEMYHEINRILDQAPDGLFVPRLRSRQEAEQVVRTAKYAPLGQRGLGGSTCPVGKYMGWPAVTDQIACGDPARLRFWKDRGMRLFWSAADICLLWEAGRRQLAGLRAALAAPEPPPLAGGHGANV